MINYRYFNLRFEKLNSVATVKLAFFLFSLVEVFAEFFNNIKLQWLTKPFLMPVLMILYVISSSKISRIYIVALFFNWCANMLFITTQMRYIAIASSCFLIYRILIIIKVLRDEKSLGKFPVILGSIPFSFLFLSLINIIYENITGGQFYLIIFQSVLMSILGGFSLANFIIKNTLSSKLLLTSSLFFGVNLFILAVKFYYIDLVFLKPFSMIFFVFGHYLFYQFMIRNDEQ